MAADILNPLKSVENRSFSYTVADIPVLLATIDGLKRIITEQQRTITELRDD
ncbi:hypothetical protein [Methanoculleus sp. 10]|uniref:hypothetical protein n=1 Tax=Methanoculleus sp. 10 TaxID=430615 RepID=UPI0025D36A2C|nr:hypothetical protein [Methanoculleus sp. 10]